ncbi:MAG: translocation/assembly module TamB [Muribaculaceae bacterium]|nr:translocation/assembly module TamB [Muribaculaceae bacterium]
MTIRVVKKAYNLYRVMRSVLFTTVVAIASLYVGLYIFLSIPPVQNYIKNQVEKELKSFLGGEVKIGEVDIIPFNEVRIKGVEFFTPEGEKCIEISTLGAGIRLWRLLRAGRIEITYAEILGLKGSVWQAEKDGPLNIAYIIEALSPKDKSKPPTKFDLQINNVVIRKSSLSFDRLWVKKKSGNPGSDEGNHIFDPNHILLTDLMADLRLPRLKNDDFTIDLRRLSFKSFSDFYVRKLALNAHITDKEFTLTDFILLVGDGEIKVGDITVNYTSLNKISEALANENHDVELSGRNLSPGDFRFFYPDLKKITDRFDVYLSASGYLDNVTVEKLELSQKIGEAKLELSGKVDNIRNRSRLLATLDYIKAHFPATFAHDVVTFARLGNKEEARILGFISRLGEVSLDLRGEYSGSDGRVVTDGRIDSAIGDISFDLDGNVRGRTMIAGNFVLNADQFNVGKLIDNNKIGEVSFSSQGDIEIKNKDFNGEASLLVDYIDYNGNRFTDINIEGTKAGNQINGEVSVDDRLVNLSLAGEANIDGERSEFKVQSNINRVFPGVFGLLPKYKGYWASGKIDAELSGNNIDNLLGTIAVEDFLFSNGVEEGLRLGELRLGSKRDSNIAKGENESCGRVINLTTEYLTASLEGDFKIKDLAAGINNLIGENITSLIPTKDNGLRYHGNAEFNVNILAREHFPAFLHLPVKPLKDVTIKGNIDLNAGKMECEVMAPYLLQGKNKLISNTRLYGVVEQGRGGSVNIGTTMPIKNDRANLEMNVTAFQDNGQIDLGWTMVNNKMAKGHVSMTGSAIRNAYSGRGDFSVTINPSTFTLGPSEWRIDKSRLFYSDKRVNIDKLRIWNDDQFVEIDGTASADPADEMNVNLAEIDLEYIFGILNINYVTFGGIATGELTASSVFTKTPVAQTRQLKVRNLSYNEAVLGDADIFSCWNNEKKEVEIHADIVEEGYGGAKVDGGVFVTRDSLSFDMKADKVNVGFLKPFMSAFTSDVGGRASGEVKLFGTFKDIDLTGKAFADSIYMKVDYTNVYYHGSDSVILDPGRIIIPSFRLYDKNGNSALFSGFVKHSYFHDPEFDFKLGDAQGLLCYDTNSSINPDWYGTIYASGKGALRGRPGIVVMEMDMTTGANSDFTFVLSDTQTALDYTFLTFSDKKKEEEESAIVVEESFEDKFLKKKKEEVSVPTIFAMDLRATVTPEAKMNLIMDPNAGDKITARGGGPLQIHYDTESDQMTMYGKYTLAEGDYNFSLQELILRDFKIREGSNISFNGDPLQANIDILASYRVNTNLSDLDKSFSTDRDLNRTNVPVDALLKVRGDLQHPEISFDISLPTLTSDVERKVRSIISTDDLMSRQIIYLLALNRFYTPEYMGASSNGGGELASVASSTLSSQLSNIMGQLTDKFTLSPSFRSDKGDFSDMEVDVSLSSRLLNNRLLINGNFGYRDRNTSQTTFVGDFDIEYLLSKNGNLRLKAYNHFNDQNYYLKSSLTTQGLGVVYRKEFDNPFTWLRRKKRKIVEDGDTLEKIEEKEE